MAETREFDLDALALAIMRRYCMVCSVDRQDCMNKCPATHEQLKDWLRELDTHPTRGEGATNE